MVLTGDKFTIDRSQWAPIGQGSVNDSVQVLSERDSDESDLSSVHIRRNNNIMVRDLLNFSGAQQYREGRKGGSEGCRI